jgi:hypothetical protein
MRPTNAVIITVKATATRPGCYEARLDGYLLVSASRQPFVDAARRLLRLGYDSTTVLVMRHAGSDTDSLTAQIGVAAKLRVKEDRRGPRFVPWEPISRRVEALVRAKAKRVARVAPDHANEPSARPGAEVATQFPPIAPKFSRPVRRRIDRTAAERERHHRARRRNDETEKHRSAEHGVTGNIKNDASR